MKFGSKPNREYPKEDKVSYKPPVKIDWKLYCVDEECLLPYGKYANKTLGWVMEHDENYMQWIYKNNIIAEWSLVKQCQQSNKVNSIYFYSETFGEKWVGIVSYPGIGIKSPFL